MFLKLKLVKYAACISLIVIGKCVPFNTFLSIHLITSFRSTCFGKNVCSTSLALIFYFESGLISTMVFILT